MDLVHVVKSLVKWADALVCGHSGDLKEILEMTTVSGMRAMKYRCMNCGAEVWEYISGPGVGL